MTETPTCNLLSKCLCYSLRGVTRIVYTLNEVIYFEKYSNLFIEWSGKFNLLTSYDGTLYMEFDQIHYEVLLQLQFVSNST